MILKIFCIQLNNLKYIYLSITYFFKDLKLHFVLKKCIIDQTCPVVHKSRRPQARLTTVTLFYIHCGIYYVLKLFVHWDARRMFGKEVLNWIGGKCFNFAKCYYCSQRQETLDLPYLTLLCDNLKNRIFFSWHYFGNFLTAASYRHHSTNLPLNKTFPASKIRLLGV
jgi:hypothetical protein